MTAINRFLYRVLRRLSGWLFNIAHKLQWLSMKAYDHSDFSRHRALYRERKHYIKNGLGYIYDYFRNKLRSKQ